MSTPNKTSNLAELYNSVKWQNDMIDNLHAKTRDLYSTDQQRIKYLLADISWYTYVNFFLWIIFYILCLAVIYYTFYGKQRGFSIFIKIVIIIAFLIFPMVCTSVELLVYHIGSYLNSIVMGKPYPKMQNEAPPFSLLNALPPGTY